MPYIVILKPSAEREFGKLQKDMQMKIKEALELLSVEPRPDGVKKLKAMENTYRHRVGNHRIIYQIQDKELIVYVVRIADRKDSY
ncbi:MAG TPA: type II toxin-antitoxin system RelE/ParE family toxin [Candidatus Kapabacteria bacterium]